MIKTLVLMLACSFLLVACGEDKPETDAPNSSPSNSSTSNSSSTNPPPNSSSNNNQPNNTTIPGNALTGKRQYQDYCEVCHGENGEGSRQLKAPSLVGCSVCEIPKALTDYTDQAMPPGGVNAAKACTGDCATNVSAYIISAFNQKPDIAACDANDPSPSVFKRLSRLEYSNTLSTLLQQSSISNIKQIPDDPSIHNFQTIASLQGVQANHLNGYISIATEQAQSLMRDASRRDRVLGCHYSSANCLDTFIGNFGRLAYRRPLSGEERSRINQFARGNSNSTEDQFVLAIQLLLSSPNFIYRVEVGNNPEGLATLTPYELASRLAFALWGQGPTAQLLDQAQNGELDSNSGLKRIAKQMLNDPKAQQNISLFFEQWLATNLIKTPVEKPQNWYDDILNDMRSETNALLGEYVREGKDFMNVFTENKTYLSPKLAKYYGLTSNSSNQATELPSGDPRQNTGILTHAANMFAKTDGDLIAIRGNWLRSTFLCKSLELPDGITEIINGAFSGYTPIEIIEARNTDRSCERCHSQIDPIGIAFAPYQRNGLFDHSVDLNDYPVEPGFPDTGNTNIKTIPEIAQALSKMPEVGECIAERLFLYTRSHEPQKNDYCSVHKASESFQDSGRQFASILLALVEDPAFRTRLAPKAQKQIQEEPTVSNVALHKSVSTSNAQDGNPGSRLTDNNTGGDSRWAAQGYPQQATIDLGRTFSIVQTEVYPNQERAYQYTIEVSTNGSSYTRVVDRSNNSKGGNAISDLFAAIDARYVRITITGAKVYDGGWAALRELKVFGIQK